MHAEREPAGSVITLDQARAILAGAAFAVDLGYRVVEVGPGSAVVVLDPQERHLRPGPVVAGPILMGLADLAFWVAAQTVVGEEPMAVTIGETSAFLRGGVGPLRCEARVLRSGRRVVYGEATVLDAGGRAVSHHTLTYLRPGS